MKNSGTGEAFLCRCSGNIEDNAEHLFRCDSQRVAA